MQPGDVILKFNGETIKRWSDLPRIVGETKPGTSADLEVWRKDKTITLPVKVGEIPAEKGGGARRARRLPDVTNALGLGVVDVPAEVQRKLRIKGGVQVKIAEGTAAKAGLQEGDIVLALNDTDVTGAKQFGELVAKLDKGARWACWSVAASRRSGWRCPRPNKVQDRLKCLVAARGAHGAPRFARASRPRAHLVSRAYSGGGVFRPGAERSVPSVPSL